MKTILTLTLLASMALALNPALPFAGMAWGGAAATALSAAIDGGKWNCIGVATTAAIALGCEWLGNVRTR